jgi:hypothetical protein
VDLDGYRFHLNCTGKGSPITGGPKRCEQVEMLNELLRRAICLITLSLLVAGNSAQPSSSAVQQAQMFADRPMRPVWRHRVDIEAHLASREALHH